MSPSMDQDIGLPLQGRFSIWQCPLVRLRKIITHARASVGGLFRDSPVQMTMIHMLLITSDCMYKDPVLMCLASLSSGRLVLSFVERPTVLCLFRLNKNQMESKLQFRRYPRSEVYSSFLASQRVNYIGAYTTRGGCDSSPFN